MSKKQMKCPKCSNDLMVDMTREFCFCEFCGEKIELSKIENNESNEVADNKELNKSIIANSVQDDVYVTKIPNVNSKSATKIQVNKQEALAIVALILGILSLVMSCCLIGGIIGIAGIVVGVLGLQKEQKKSFCVIGISLSGLAILCSLIFLIAYTNQTNSTVSNEQTTEMVTTEAVKYKVNIEVHCVSNLLFNKYDVNVYVDGEQIGTIDHGTDASFDVELEEGKYEVRFEKEDSSSVDGTATIVVSCDTKVKYDITCEGSQVSIKSTDSLKIPIDNNELGELKSKEVIKQFEDAGFTNIKKDVIKDLDAESLKKKSIVTEISIDGDNTISKEKSYLADAEVKITYHTAREIEVGLNSYDAEEKTFEELQKILSDNGFVKITTETKETGDQSLENQVFEVQIKDDSYFNQDDKYPIDAKIIIIYYVYDSSITTEEIQTEEANDDTDNSSTTASSDSYDKYDAQIDFENYCESIYIYGVKLHWFLNCLASEEREDGTYFFKVGATITTIFGTKYDTVVEGVVDSNGNIVSFYEY